MDQRTTELLLLSYPSSDPRWDWVQYDHSKYTLKRLGLMREGTPLHLLSSVAAAAVTTIVTQPVDTIKTCVPLLPSAVLTCNFFTPRVSPRPLRFVHQLID
jgi:hypothetical protein